MARRLFEVKATRVHTHTESGDVVYHVQATSEAEARALVDSVTGMGRGHRFEVGEERMRGDDETSETETIDSVEVLQVENESGGRE
jgi:hypothetical protein